MSPARSFHTKRKPMPAFGAGRQRPGREQGGPATRSRSAGKCSVSGARNVV